MGALAAIFSSFLLPTVDGSVGKNENAKIVFSFSLALPSSVGRRKYAGCHRQLHLKSILHKWNRNPDNKILQSPGLKLSRRL